MSAGLSAVEMCTSAGDSMAGGKDSFGQTVDRGEKMLGTAMAAVLEEGTEGESSCYPPSL